ncbi:MAG TPA: aldo/keto reductase [Thermotoga sp.]|nr:aldo/keto reductase [Thermotoga sp.]
MKYRKFGKHDIKVSLLGFGAMRLPILDNDEAKVDEDKAIEMIRYAINNGVNYVDTAYPYHKGNSEYIVGKALKSGYRERVFLATKSPVWLVESHHDFDRFLDEQLRKLDTDHIDMYLLHALNKKRWKKVKDLKVFEFLEKAREKGKIRYIGFSFHDDFSTFCEIIDYYDWDFCQIQLNYMDEYYQAGIRGLKYAGSKNVAVVVMEPLKGGKLAKPPKEVKKIFEESGKDWSPVEWAFRWIGNFEEVSVILSGMSSLEQVIDNIRIMDKILPNSLNEEDLNVIKKVQAFYRNMVLINCTECGYCMPCSSGVDIPGIFRLYNEGHIYGTLEESKRVYQWFQSDRKDASQCTECGDCEKVCPQKLKIRELLKMVDRELAKIET